MAPPVVVRGRVLGAERVSRGFRLAGPRAQTAVRRELHVLGLLLANKVKRDKLTGQVLNRRTGRLASSINARQVERPGLITESVGTKVSYGRAWELGFTIPARMIEAKKAGALFWPGAAHPVARVNQPARTQAARPFLVPALEEMRPTIRARLTMALQGVVDGG